ncbi:MAG: DUF4435 domain-containing protein [Bacteroidales bacterium]|nr:DUF4435 domain-containing protein [Bacteroidales bacterium]
MGTVDRLRQEREGRTVPLAQFLDDYKKDAAKLCYGFVEGKDDPSYYRTVIKNKINNDCKILLYPSGGKGNVKYVYEEIHKRDLPNDRIVYFMDRDLSSVIEDGNIIIDSHVYITDNYSIENDILNSDTLESVMQDLLGFSTTPMEEIEKVKKLYNEQLLDFETKMLPIMANIIVWKRKRIKPANYSQLKINKLFKVKDGSLSQIVTDDEIIKKLYQDSQADYSKYSKTDADNVIREIQDASLVHQIVRGKYLSVFFIMFCNSLYKEYANMGISAPTNNGRELSDRDIMETIAPRARVPQSLNAFIDNTIMHYYRNLAA